MAHMNVNACLVEKSCCQEKNIQEGWFFQALSQLPHCKEGSLLWCYIVFVFRNWFP